MRVNALSNIGVRRKDNQDNYWCAVYDIKDVEYGILCLCDGMGGLDNGSLASRLVVEAVRDTIKCGDSSIDLLPTLQKVNNVIVELGGSQNVTMGTTCTVIVCSSGKYKIWHIGDSRCYIYTNNGLVQLTTDHSALNKYKITREANLALWEKYKNSLTRCIGVKPTINVDFLEGTYDSNSLFLVCTDGLWHNLDMGISRDKLLNLSSLVQEIISLGETDNITACVLECKM